uniref:putative disease resistance protein At1g59780 isoform X2 n=1 Tax=Erigeron canadensis TaxID=72917 RepID=UPI001CB9C024|nr:putative disease resistance protein At1g59780 isoform X2 [Erigeron canadensis]
MAVEAVVSVVLQKLNDMLKAQSLNQNTLIVYEVQEIMKSLNSIRELMISIKSINHKAHDYLDDVYMIEDKVEKFTLHVVCRRKVFGFLTNHIFIINNLNSCKKIHQKVKNIVTRLMELKGQQRHIKMTTIKGALYKDTSDDENADGKYKTIPVNHVEELSFSYSCNEEAMQIVGVKDRFQETKHMSSFSYREKEMDIFGLKEDIKTLVNHLINDSEHVFSIVGQRGIGKTTLARAIYKHRDIKKHFEFRAWVSMLPDYSTKDVLLSLLKAMDSITVKTTNMDDEKEMKLKLGIYLTNKRYLVVLDGANTCYIREDLKEIFTDVKNGSKLVLTSSQTMDTIQPSIPLPGMCPLNEADTLEMLKEKVGEEKSPDLLPENSKLILQICKGLPLNIVLLARLLSMRDPSNWPQLFSRMKNSVSIFSLCYDDLSDDLKVCLLYLVLFPKEFDIPVRRLLRLWLAEGFVKENLTQEFQEDTAQMYFEELVNRNMIQISKLRSDNSPRGCRVLGPLHDFLRPKARQTNLFYTYSNLLDSEEVGSLNIRRLVEYESPKMEQGTDRTKIPGKENGAYPSSSYLSSFTSGENKTKNQSEIEMSNLFSPKKTQPKSSGFNPSNLRSYISFNHRKTDYKQAKQIGSFLCNIINDGFGLLRVLDLEGVYKPILPENLGNLCNIRYLGLRFTYLDSLPESVGELTHLETLDLKHTCIDELPDSILRLKKLRHLNLNEMYLNEKLQYSLRLLTLWGLCLDEKVSIKDGLDKMQILRELGITFLLGTNQEDLLNWIGNSRDLRSLRLRSKDNLGRPSKLMFKSMSNLVQLSHLNLLGNLEKLPHQNEFPPTLKVLTLSISLLEQDPMETLGQLPCLTVLRLLGQSFIGKEMVCRKGGFTKLRELKMWMLKELESWSVEEGSMQSLKHLDIRCCEKLQTIPVTLLQQHQLEKLVLTSMPHAFTAEVKRLKSEHTSLTINHWKFPPLPWESKDSTLVKHGKN